MTAFAPMQKEVRLSAFAFKVWRARLGWTQARAAAQLCVPLRTYQEWEQGRRGPQQEGPIRKLMDKVEPKAARRKS